MDTFKFPINQNFWPQKCPKDLNQQLMTAIQDKQLKVIIALVKEYHLISSDIDNQVMHHSILYEKPQFIKESIILAAQAGQIDILEKCLDIYNHHTEEVPSLKIIQTIFERAVKNGITKIVNLLFPYIESVNFTSSHCKFTMLELAINLSYIDIVITLVNYGGSHGYVMSSHFSRLFKMACHEKNIQLVRVFLREIQESRAGGVLSQEMSHRIFWLAVKGGNAEIVLYCTTNLNINIEYTDENNESTFMVASKMGHLDTLKVQFSCEYFYQLFMGAVKRNAKNIITYLIQAWNKQNLSIDLANSILGEIVCNNYVELIEPILNLGASLTVKKKGNLSLLYSSVDSQHLEMTKKLIELAPSLVDEPANSGSDPLQVAVARGNLQLMDLLLIEGKSKSLSKKYINGNMLLHLAAFSGPPDMIVKLIELGLKVDEKNDRGETALTEAMKNNNVPVMNVLLKNGANVHVSNLMGFSIFENFSKNNNYLVSTYRLLSAMSLRAVLHFRSFSIYDNYINAFIKAIKEKQALILAILSPVLPDNNNEPSPMVNLPMDLKKLIVLHLDHPVWYQHRLNDDIELAVNRIDEMKNNRKISENIFFSEPLIFSNPKTKVLNPPGDQLNKQDDFCLAESVAVISNKSGSSR